MPGVGDQEEKVERLAPFKPLPRHMANAISAQVQVIFAANPADYLPKGPNPCALCVHGKRFEIDSQLLQGIGVPAIRETMGLMEGKDTKQRRYLRDGLWPRARFLRHRDYHLLPIVQNEVQLNADALMDLPYPKDGSERDKAWWYLLRCYSIHEKEVRAGNMTSALSALKEMRRVDIEMPSAPIKQATVAASNDEIPKEFPEDEDRLKLAFERSRVRKAQPVEVEDVEAQESGGNDSTSGDGHHGPSAGRNGDAGTSPA